MILSWQRRPAICRAHQVLLVDGQPNGWWIHAVQHPTANRPYTVHKPNGEAVGPNLSTLWSAKRVLLSALVALAADTDEHELQHEATEMYWRTTPQKESRT